jgi:hypothetical protein
MIKRALIKDERAGVPSEMLFMTLSTFLADHLRMETVLPVDRCPDRSVTIQALPAADFLADFMAPCAIRRPFQEPVGL